MRRRTIVLRGAGIVALTGAAVSVIVMPPSWLTIGLAALSWVLLARDPAFGALPAALAVMLALPYDRAADVEVVRVVNVPVRPQDAVIALAVIVSLPALRSIVWTPVVRLLAIFAVIGIVALALGIVNGNEPRDIFRDVRWWGLYGTGLLAAGDRRGFAPVFRAVFLGLTVYGLLLVGAALAPFIDGGLKARAMTFDFGILRLQFGPTPFLLLPAAYALVQSSRPGSRATHIAGAIIFIAALTLSLTRATTIVLLLVAALVAVGGLLRQGGISLPRRVAGAVLVGVLVVVGIGVGLGINAVGVRVAELTRPTGVSLPTPAVAASDAASQTPAPAATSSPRPTPTFEPTGPLNRVVADAETLMAAIADRLEGYRSAIELIAAAPVTGHGLGTLVRVDYEFGAGEFDTPGKLPNVDNAYLTAAMKAGLPGSLVLAALIGWPLWALARRGSVRATHWLLPAWLGIAALTFTQSFAVIGHSPFAIAILLVAIDRLSTRRAIRTHGSPAG